MKAYIMYESGEHGAEDIGPHKDKDEGVDYDSIIKCDMIDVVRRVVGGKDYMFVVDDEGLLTGRLPVARGVHNGATVEALVGTLVVVGMPDGDGWCQSLSDKDIENIESHIQGGLLVYAF